MSHIQTFRDILHLMWFAYPVIASLIIGVELGKNEIDEESYCGGMLTVIVAQTLLAVGYVYGWNVQ